MTSFSPRPRMLFVAHRFQKNDGQGRVNYEVVKDLLQHEFPVTLLTAHVESDIADHPSLRIVRIGADRLPLQILRNLGFAEQSAKWIRKHRDEFDLIQGNGFITWEPCDIITAHFVHTAWRRNPQYPFAQKLTPYNLYQRSFTAMNSRWERGAFSRAKQIIAVSDVVAENVAALGVTPERIQVISNGVDTVEFAPGAEERASFGLPTGVPLAVFVGDIKSPRKNVGTLLRAAALVPGLHLAIAGNTQGSSAPEQAATLGIGDRVHFLGKTKRVPALMRSADLFVFPSRYESFGLVVLEAMSSGLPCIISRNIESYRMLGDSPLILQDTESADELAELMRTLIEDPELRRRLGAEARVQALNLSWARSTEAYRNTYLSLFQSQTAAY